VTKSARRAAAIIAQRIEHGESVIKFPRKVAMLATISGWLPVGMRSAMQRKRLAKRQSQSARRAGK
jgi:hypothetical protein